MVVALFSVPWDIIALNLSLIQYSTVNPVHSPPGEVQEIVALSPEGKAVIWVAGSILSEEGSGFRRSHSRPIIFYGTVLDFLLGVDMKS
jgi:hypothetical protein